MGKFEYLVPKEELINRITIETIRKDEVRGKKIWVQKLRTRMEYYNGLKIKFAIEKLDSLIEIFTEAARLED